MSEIILYTSEDGKSRIQLRAKDGTVWLSQREMAELFHVSADNISLHLKNIYEDEELDRSATTEESSVVQMEGGREVRRPLTLYNLEAILAIGYRVRSPRGAPAPTGRPIPAQGIALGTPTPQKTSPERAASSFPKRHHAHLIDRATPDD